MCVGLHRTKWDGKIVLICKQQCGIDIDIDIDIDTGIDIDINIDICDDERNFFRQ